MAEEQIERVAKAIWDAGFDRKIDPTWQDTSELQKRFHRMLAKEAIAAMENADEISRPLEAEIERLRRDRDRWKHDYENERLRQAMERKT